MTASPVPAIPAPAPGQELPPLVLPIGRRNDIIGLIDKTRLMGISDTEIYHSLRAMGFNNTAALQYMGLVASVRN